MIRSEWKKLHEYRLMLNLRFSAMWQHDLAIDNGAWRYVGRTKMQSLKNCGD